MDAAISRRKYPSYTTTQLEAFVASENGNASMVQEIADRKSGSSVVAVIPQIVPQKDTSHLVALHEGLSHERTRLAAAKNAAEFEIRSVWVAQKEREVRDEFVRLGMTPEANEISLDELAEGLEEM